MERLSLDKFKDKKLDNIIKITGQGFHTGWMNVETLTQGTDVCCDEDGSGDVSAGDTIEFSDGVITLMM
jgi:hypothetical protein